MNEYEYERWKEGGDPNLLYRSGLTFSDRFCLPIENSDTYYIVFFNSNDVTRPRVWISAWIRLELYDVKEACDENAIRGDFNGDGRVNFADFLIFVGLFQADN